MHDNLHVFILVLAWQLQRRRVSMPNLLRGGKFDGRRNQWGRSLLF